MLWISGDGERPTGSARPLAPAVFGRVHWPERAGPVPRQINDRRQQQQPALHRRPHPGAVLQLLRRPLPGPAVAADKLLAGEPRGQRALAAPGRQAPAELRLSPLPEGGRASRHRQREEDADGARPRPSAPGQPAVPAVALPRRGRAYRGPSREHRQVPEGAVRRLQPRDQRQGRVGQGGQGFGGEHRGGRPGRGALRRRGYLQAQDNEATKKLQDQPEEVSPANSNLLLIDSSLFIISLCYCV